jgi:hypothetical protein
MSTKSTGAGAIQPGDVTPTGEAASRTTGQPPVDTTSQSELTEAQAHPDRTYHDSVSGRPVDADGNRTDGEGKVEPHRVVSDSWPEDRKDS